NACSETKVRHCNQTKETRAMRRRRFIAYALPALALIMLPVGGFAQEAGGGLGELLSGKAGQLSLTVKELDASWRRVLIRTTERTAGKPAGAPLSVQALAGEDNQPKVYYTQGKTILQGGKTFLLAYRPQ